jgi:hypothetical protein
MVIAGISWQRIKQFYIIVRKSQEKQEKAIA